MSWTDRYVDSAASGSDDGTSTSAPWTLAQGIANAAAGMRLNIKAGTYANGSTSRTFAAAGTTSAPVWWRGYASTPGDLDGVANPPSQPTLTFTSGQFVLTGAHHIFSHLKITGSSASDRLVAITSGDRWKFVRCKIVNTSSGSTAYALRASTLGVLDSCYLEAAAGASWVAVLDERCAVVGCRIHGGVGGITAGDGANEAAILANLFTGQGSGESIAINTSNSRLVLTAFNSIRKASGPGITVAGGAIGYVGSNLIECGTYGVAVGSATNLMHRSHNGFFATSGAESGFGDSPDFARVTESASPFEDPGSVDYSLKSGALSIDAGLPGEFEGP